MSMHRFILFLLLLCPTISGAQTILPAKNPGTAVKPPPAITGRSAIIIDAATGQILYQKNADERRPVASTQKLLTALLVCEAGNLDRLTAASAYDAACEPTKMYLRPGLEYPRRTLLNGLLVHSANDCARCLARSYAGTEDAFAVVMNKRAALLGMKNTRFLNASGLPAEQYSTARDMALLARAALYQPVIRSIVRQPEYVFAHPDGKTSKINNTNRLLGQDPYVNGMKTGYTDAAGKCLICSGTAKGKMVITVILGSTSAKIWNETKGLMHWGLGVP